MQKQDFFSLYLTLVKGLDIASLSETTIDVKTNQIFRSVPIPLHQIGNRIVATIAFPWTWSKWKRSTSIFVPARALAKTKILEKSKTRFVSHLLALSEGTWHCLSSSKTIMHAKAKKDFFSIYLPLVKGLNIVYLWVRPSCMPQKNLFFIYLPLVKGLDIVYLRVRPSWMSEKKSFSPFTCPQRRDLTLSIFQ